MAHAIHQGATALRAMGALPLRRPAVCMTVAYHGNCQAVPSATRLPNIAAALPQRRYFAARSRAGRRRGEALVVRASWGADVQFSTAKIMDRQLEATQLHRVVVDLGSLGEGYTQPGQFIQVKVGDSKPGFFAISSPPDPNNAGVVELLIKDQPGSTAELLCQASPGDEVMVSPVMGKGFPVGRVPPSSHPTLLLFATGSGVSPVKALVECQEALQAGQRRDVRLYYGARTLDHMAFKDRIPEWEKAGVKVVKVLSEEGEGYVQEVFEKETGISDWEGVAAVLCGQKGMCEAVTGLLTGKGVPKEDILLNF